MGKNIEEKLDEALVFEEEQPYQVPENWCWIKLGNGIVTKLRRGGIDEFNGKKNYLSTKCIKYDCIEQIEKEITYDNRPSRANLQPENGDVIFAKMQNTTKVICINQKLADNYIFSTGFISVIPLNDMYDDKFLAFLFRSEFFNQAKNSLATGTTQKAINKTNSRKLKVPFLPLKEQKRIVNKIESMLSKAKQARELVEGVEKSFKDRKKSILAKAFHGKLTEEWRGENEVESAKTLLNNIEEEREAMYERQCELAKSLGKKKPRRPRKPKKFDNKIISDSDLPDNWIKTFMGCIIYSFRYGTSNKSNYDFNGLPVIRIPNISSGSIDFEDLKYLKENEIKENKKVKNGDVLIIRSNGSKDLIGKSALVNNLNQDDQIAFASYLIRLRPILVLPKYLLYLLNSSNVKEQLFSSSKSTSGINNINTKELASIEIPLPPLEEQREIVSVLDSMLGKMEKEKEIIKEVKGKLDILEKSILAKAFRGELGTNNPEDGDALELLKEVLSEE